MNLIYFCSEFPCISHTFILREIESLRENGFEIFTVSVNPPQHMEKMSGFEKRLATETLYLKKTPFLKILFTLATMTLQMPTKIIRMAWAATLLAILKGPKCPKKAFGYFIEAALLVQTAHRKDISHIHVHFANPAATVALIASRSGDVAYSLSIHGPDVFYDVEINLLREKVAGAAFVRCISHFCKSQLCRLLGYNKWSKLHVVRCGIDLYHFSPRSFPNGDIPHLLCVGRLSVNKGQHVLIEACARLKASGIPFHLTLVGDGVDRGGLEHHASALGLAADITFTGAEGQDRVKDLYRSADLFILPSFAEGLPVVLMEAMAMEIPVISTSINGIPELINSGKNGFLVPPGDVEALFEKIKLLLEQPQVRLDFGKRARDKVAALYNLAENCPKLAEIFRAELKEK